MKRFGRRTFFKAGSLGLLTLALGRLQLGAVAGEAEAARSPATRARHRSSYGDWRDVYRDAWSWDRVVRGTHTNANCVSACAWNLYVRDGIVWREEQAGSYDEGCTGCPDFNPRGCQKGASYSDLMIAPSRLRYPLRRVGARGSCRWKRISWQEALEQVATGMVDAVQSRGGHGLIGEIGPESGYGPHSAAPLRFFKMLGAPITDSMAMIGDINFGGTITLGTAHTDGSSDDWFRSDYLVLWAFNPVSTRIPDAHFLAELRYRGGRVVSIAPDYNASMLHSDLWLNPRPGSDAALALAAVQVILSEGLHNRAYIEEQTDLPLLVRKDTGRFLRAADLEQGAGEDVFYVWDNRAEQLAPAPGSRGSSQATLSWGDIEPALKGSWPVGLADGGAAVVEPVFAMLRRRLNASCRPEQAARLTGISEQSIVRFAREFARAPRALILSQYGSCKFYHSDLLQRAQILLASVTGNIGRPGGGWRSGAFVALEGMPLLAMQKDLGILDLIILLTRSYFQKPGESIEEFSRYFVPSGLWHYMHGGLDRYSGEPAYGDPALKRAPDAYVREALAKGLFPVHPDQPPSMLLSVFGNVLRHSRSGQRLLEHLWPKLDLVVDVNFRLSRTGLASDIVLPAAGWYEKIGFKYIPALIPYVTLGDRAVAPLGESKPEWEIFYRLAEAVARVADERGVDSYQDYLGVERRLGRLEAAFSDDGRFGADDEERLADFILKVSKASNGMDLATLRATGQQRIKSLGQQGATTGIYSDYEENEPIVPLQWSTKQKKPYPTLTGRQQFYVDHPWFLELDEALPRYKPPPAAGGDYPLTLSGGHTRWSIHAIWRDHALMLRMQRGEPIVLLGKQEAIERGIPDHAKVRVYNDVSSFLARAKVMPALPPGFLMVYHAWEPYQFEGWHSQQHLAPSPIKVTQLAADYGHLAWSFAHYEPGQVDRDTRVEIERAD